MERYLKPIQPSDNSEILSEFAAINQEITDIMNQTDNIIARISNQKEPSMESSKADTSAALIACQHCREPVIALMNSQIQPSSGYVQPTKLSEIENPFKSVIFHDDICILCSLSYQENACFLNSPFKFHDWNSSNPSEREKQWTSHMYTLQMLRIVTPNELRLLSAHRYEKICDRKVFHTTCGQIIFLAPRNEREPLVLTQTSLTSCTAFEVCSCLCKRMAYDSSSLHRLQESEKIHGIERARSQPPTTRAASHVLLGDELNRNLAAC